MKKKLFLGTMSALLLAGCSADKEVVEEPKNTENEYSIAMVTDTGGVDDRSFNQSAWEGMNEWAEEHSFGDDSIKYFQSEQESDYVPHLNSATNDDHEVVFGIGFLLEDPVRELALQNPEQKYGIIDANVEEDNVVSIGFADHEAAFLAGVVAAETTETGKVGFIGGIEGIIIDRFHTGFLHGVEYTGKDVEVDIQYADSFTDAGVGQQIASAMYSNGADIVFHAAGGVGNGVFQEARNRMEDGSDLDLWVIGVDSDQEAEGKWDGGNLTLTSTLKEVGQSIKLSTNQAMEDNFQGGEFIQYNLEDGGVDVTRGNISDEVWETVQAAKEDIINGTIEVNELSYSQED